MLSVGNILLIILIFLILFGAKNIPQIMYDLGLGVKAFKDALEGNDSDIVKKKLHQKKTEEVNADESLKDNIKKKKNVSIDKKARPVKL